MINNIVNIVSMRNFDFNVVYSPIPPPRMKIMSWVALIVTEIVCNGFL